MRLKKYSLQTSVKAYWREIQIKTYLEKAVVQDSDVAQSSFERHFSAKAQTPPRHS